MTNRYISFFLLFFSFTLLVNCEKEQAAPREYPRVRTKNVTNISDEGARFNAEVINDAGILIEEHGFIWEQTSYMNYDYSERVLMGEMDGEGNFSYDVTFALKPGASYYLKAFIKANGVTVFGELVNFTSQGCLPPVITGFNPKSGFWGDTVIITGSNFSYQPYTNKVTFGNYQASVVAASENELKVVVPSSLTILDSYSVSVQVNDFKASSSDNFSVIQPFVISHINPDEVTWGDTIVISGEFSSLNYSYVRIGGVNSNILQIDQNSCKTIIPTALKYRESYQIDFVYGSKVIPTNLSVNLKLPVIEGLEPASGEPGDIIAIVGNYFNPEISKNRVIVGSKDAIINYTDNNEVHFTIPQLPPGNYDLTIYSGNYNIAFPIQLMCENSSITPYIYDIDGNVYRTILAGDQHWMADNLKTTKFQNGESIPLITDTWTWTNTSTIARTYYGNVTNYNIYGGLYNWYAVADPRNVCPSGWHVPDQNEWNELINYLGGAQTAGGKLKELGLRHWRSPNTGATDEIEFTALPAGRKESSGYYNLLNSYGFFWTSTGYSTTDAVYTGLSYSQSDIAVSHVPKKTGNSVRCVKNE